MKARVYLICGAFLFAASASSAAELLAINVTGRVVSVSDNFGLLGNQIVVGQSVSGSYTYDPTTPDQNPLNNYGQYLLSQGGIRLSIGSLIVESDTSSSMRSYGADTHSAYDAGNGPGFLRLRSGANKPLPSGATVTSIELSLEGGEPTSDALPTSAPNLNVLSYRTVFFYGQSGYAYYRVEIEIESAEVGTVPVDPVANELRVSPASTILVRGLQRFDAVLLAPPGSEVVFARAIEGGTPLPMAYPGSCVAGPNIGRPLIVCPDAHMNLPPSGGLHQIDWEVYLSDGRVLRQTVDWTLVP